MKTLVIQLILGLVSNIALAVPTSYRALDDACRAGILSASQCQLLGEIKAPTEQALTKATQAGWTFYSDSEFKNKLSTRDSMIDQIVNKGVIYGISPALTQSSVKGKKVKTTFQVVGSKSSNERLGYRVSYLSPYNNQPKTGEGALELDSFRKKVTLKYFLPSLFEHYFRGMNNPAVLQ